MTPHRFLTEALDPGLRFLRAVLPAGDRAGAADDRVRLMLLAIAGQETTWCARLQIGGPARSYWQFERGGGIRQVLNHHTTAERIAAVLTTLDISSAEATVFEAVAWNDLLAVAVARLLLWTDPPALPPIGAEEEAWATYARVWKPGRPRRESWSARYTASLQSMRDVAATAL